MAPFQKAINSIRKLLNFNMSFQVPNEEKKYDCLAAQRSGHIFESFPNGWKHFESRQPRKNDALILNDYFPTDSDLLKKSHYSFAIVKP